MAAPATPAIRAERLRVNRGGRDVLHDISFEVERGRITGLLGPSGTAGRRIGALALGALTLRRRKP